MNTRIIGVPSDGLEGLKQNWKANSVSGFLIFLIAMPLVFLISDLEFAIPNFALEPERLWTKFFEHTWGKDIDFRNHPDFSKKYYLRADNEIEVRGFFRDSLIGFLEKQPDFHIESQRGKLLVYDKREKLSSEEIQSVLIFVGGFVQQLRKIEPQPAQL